MQHWFGSIAISKKNCSAFCVGSTHCPYYLLWLIIVSYYYYFEESFDFTFEERQTESGSNDVFCKEKIFNFAIKIRVYFKKNILQSFSITFASIMDNLFILKSRYPVLKKKRENMSNQKVKYCMRLTIISC